MIQEIGLTGGIGSGKSTVARAFEALGYRVYYADDRARALYNEDAALKEAMIALVGPQLYDADGKFVRAVLADTIFADKALLARVNALVHPAVGRDYERWRAACPADYARPAVFKEAAILFEAGTHAALARVLMVYAPKQVRLARVQQRDGIASAQVVARMASQWPDSRKIALSDFIIYNDGRHALLPQVQSALQWIAAL
jgi:dephospho-CoA kinase